MTTSNGFTEKTVDVEKRRFELQVLEFANGYFVSVTEGKKKIGSMVASLAIGPKPVTSTIIPAKTESFFLKLLSERICSKIQGIVIVSAFFENDLDNNTARNLMSNIMEMIDDD